MFIQLYRLYELDIYITTVDLGTQVQPVEKLQENTRKQYIRNFSKNINNLLVIFAIFKKMAVNLINYGEKTS